MATDTVIWSDEMFRILQRDPAEGPGSYADHLKLYLPRTWPASGGGRGRREQG